MLEEVVNYYVNSNTNCLVLLKRKSLCPLLARLLVHLYCNQQLYVNGVVNIISNVLHAQMV